MTSNWKCRKCGGINSPNHNKCLGCNTPRMENNQFEEHKREEKKQNNLISNNKIKCPNCGSYATVPMEEKNIKNLGYMLAITGHMFSENPSDFDTLDVDFSHTWNNGDKFEKFKTGQIGAYCKTCKYKFDDKAIREESSQSSHDIEIQKISTTERLKELKALLAEGLITIEEYNWKRDEILKDL